MLHGFQKYALHEASVILIHFDGTSSVEVQSLAHEYFCYA